jgi:hypothetical protein
MGECRNDACDVLPGNLECLSVDAFFNHFHRTGQYRFEQTCGARRRVVGNKWVAIYAGLAEVNWARQKNTALNRIYNGLGGENALKGKVVARGVITMVVYVREVRGISVPFALRARPEGATYVVEFVHVRPVWPPLPVPGLKNYQNHPGLTPDIQKEIRSRLLPA